jgi:hypothetical protein
MFSRKHPMTLERGMSVQQTEETMAAYFQDLLGGGPYVRHFADEMVMSLMWTDQVAHGPAEAERMIDLMHKQAFAAMPVVKITCVGAGHAYAEIDFVAKHIGEFAQVAAAGKEVNVPYCVAYDLAEGKITALRLYLPMQELLRQIGAPSA